MTFQTPPARLSRVLTDPRPLRLSPARPDGLPRSWRTLIDREPCACPRPTQSASQALRNACGSNHGTPVRGASASVQGTAPPGVGSAGPGGPWRPPGRACRGLGCHSVLPAGGCQPTGPPFQDTASRCMARVTNSETVRPLDQKRPCRAQPGVSRADATSGVRVSIHTEDATSLRLKPHPWSETS